MAPAPAMDVDEEGAGGGARNQSSLAVAKSDAVCTNAGPPVVDPEPVKYVGGDSTECSSSFGDTCSGFQDAAGNGEPEVNSGMFARADGGRPWKPPRKKVTAEWRNSVRPVLWRCQWLELRMRELSSQVSKYDRELALNKKQNELQAASKENGSMSESMQILKGHGNSIMKRRKRRHEENLDTPLYINKHQILSYYHDKQNKGAETDGLLIDDGSGSTVPIRGGLDCVTLLDSEDYDVIFEQLTLKDILLTIDGVQSRVHLLRGRLSNAHYEGRNLAFSEGNTHVRVAQKRQHTQKHLSYTECRYTKPQKKKNLNVLLKDDNGPALSGRPSLDRKKDANRSAEEISRECKQLREKGITVDLLLGIGNSMPNGYIEDLWKENSDDVLIDNQATSDVCQQFDKARHLPSETCSKELNISAPMEVKNTGAPVKVDSTCAPVEVDTTCALAVGQESSIEKSALKEPVSSGSKQEPNSRKKKRKKGSLFTRKQQRNEASKTPAVKEKTEGTLSAANTQTESTPSSVAKDKTKGMPSAATGPQTMTTHFARKKLKSVNEPADAKEHGSGNLFLVSTEQKTGKPSSALKRKEVPKTPAAKEKTEGKPSAANTHNESTLSAVAKQKTEGTRSAATGPRTMIARFAGKKQKSVNEPADAKEHGSGNLFSALREQATGLETMKARSAGKKRKSVNEPADGKEHGYRNLFSALREQASGLETLTARSAGKKRKSVNEPADGKEHGYGNLFSASTEQATGLENMTARSAGKKCKSVNEPADAKKHGVGNLFSASMEQATGLETMTARSAGKKRKSVNEPADVKEHGSGNLFSVSMEQKTGKPSSAVKKQKTEKLSTAGKKHGSGNSSSASMEQKTGKLSSAVKKQKTKTLSTAAMEHRFGNSSSALKAQKTEKGSLAVKKQETEHLSAAANKQEAECVSSAKKQQATENLSSIVKKAEPASVALESKLQVEKAVPVAVDSRRSQRVRKPKVFAE